MMNLLCLYALSPALLPSSALLPPPPPRPLPLVGRRLLPSSALLPPPPRPLPLVRRRLCAAPRCAASNDDKDPPPLGGKLDEFDIDPTDPDSSSIKFVRPPPAYPEGLHEAAKADRTGPFWSSLGEPDESTGVRPPYLRRDDWHISSTYTAEERAAVAEAEAAHIAAASAKSEVAVDAYSKRYDDPNATYETLHPPKEFMKLGPDVAESANTMQPSKFTMPSSWQTYQQLQADVAELAQNNDLSAKVRSEAATHAEKLAGFYDTFKDVLAAGWTLERNVEVEAAVEFVENYQPPEQEGTYVSSRALGSGKPLDDE